MASGQERIATANAVQKGDKVVVTCITDGLQVGFFDSKAKNGMVSVKIEPQGFDMTAQVKDKGGKETTFRKVVKKLPGKLDVDNCTWKTEKGKVVITLAKESKDQSWEAQLSMRGLEQQSDEEEDN